MTDLSIAYRMDNLEWTDRPMFGSYRDSRKDTPNRECLMLQQT